MERPNNERKSRFPWNIVAKSVDAMFSGGAMKHILKFVVKMKLGKFILGDIDLDQLELQILSGTAQLTDLALNVDYINQKLGSLPVSLKEGSIGSLLAKFSWSGNSCQIEVDELELVFVPCVKTDTSAGAETTSSTTDGCKQPANTGSEKRDRASVNYSSTAVPLDVHEGVKTIAKMVKWLLTSFHIKVKKLIVAYDPYSDRDKTLGSHKSLVLRIRELEYGTSVSEDSNARSTSWVDNLLGMSKLTNFIKFEGTSVEFLQMYDIENHKNPTQPPGSPGLTFSDWSMGSMPLEATTPILTGEGGGFSGNLKLSIPWRNGSLDIHKVDADVTLDPIDLRLNLNTITWFLCSWKYLKNLDQDTHGHMHDNNSNSVYFNSASLFHSAMIATDRVSMKGENFSAQYLPETSQETPRDALFRGSHVISNWLALSTNLGPNGGAEAEPDLSASVEQFFECFDGLRSSHSTMGNSGILNWTRSYFSAITAASSLASGSLLLPSGAEQQAVETNFKASFSGISVELDFCDKSKKHTCGPTDNSIKGDQNAHYLGAKCEGVLLVLQICPRETKFEATIQHMELDDYFNNASEDVDSGLSSCASTIYNQSLSILELQAEVQGALPPCSFLQDLDSKAKTRNDLRSFASHPAATTKSINSSRTAYGKDFVKMKLLKTSIVTPCQLTMKMAQLDGTKASSTSFSLRLPPFIFWLNFNLVNKLLDFLKQIENSVEKKKNEEFGIGDLNERCKSSAPGDMKGTTSACLTSSSSKRSLRGSIYLSSARIVLCFPSEKTLGFNRYFLWHQFIGLDITPALSKENFMDACLREASLPPTYSDKVSGFIYLNVENLKMHLIVGNAEDARTKPRVYKHAYFAKEILSVTSGTKIFSCIGLLWQDGPVTGPWVLKMARELATSQDSIGSRTRVTGKGAEFASVTTMRDQDYTSSYTQELILSSAFLLHIRLPSVSVKLTSTQYQLLHRLCDLIMSDLLPVDLDTGSASTNNIEKKIASTSQTSILVECNSVEIITNLDKLEDRKCSLHTELPGSWHKLKLQIQKVELLSVSNIGGVYGSKFFWVNHGEGELWASVDEFPDQELLLVSCSDSTMQRGDGEGANALSSGSSGTIIVCLLDPEILRSFTTVTISGGTIIAPGGRLDWLNAICNFFILPSTKDPECQNSDLDGSSEVSGDYQSSFVFNMVDIALSYESWKHNLVINDRVYESDSSGYVNASENCGDHVACLLAAASLNLSNQTVASSIENEYKITLQDLGLLLCASPGPRGGNNYDVEYLHRAGYVKVAGEALVEAVVRTNCKSGLIWEVECCDSQINVDTCHDTTSGLVRLAAQLQKLFAPDLEESMVHLQSRWQAVQQDNCSNDFTNGTDIFDGCSASLPNQLKASVQDMTGSSRLSGIGLMDNICEDAFQFDGNCTRPSESAELQSTTSIDTSHHVEAYLSKVSDQDYFSQHVVTAMPQAGYENTHTISQQKDCFPKLIESYYISALCPTSEVPTRNRSIIKPKCDSKKQSHAGVQSGSSGWYNEKTLNIVENHIPKVSSQPGVKDIPVKNRLPPNTCKTPDDVCKARGKVLLKNIDVRWRMYGGSDWPGSTKNGQRVGRDTSVCLEFKLSSVDLKYCLYPDDEVSMSKLSLSVQDFYLYDCSRDAPWKLILGYYHSKDHPRESTAKAFKLDLEAVRPDPSTPLEEYRLRLAFLPILLHLDQDQLDFLVNFFGEKEVLVDQSTRDECGSGMSATNSSKVGESTIAEEALLPFFQKFDIWPIVFRVDYSPRRVDLAALRRGNYVHLINLVPWKGIELKLKHVHAVGVYGWSSVCETIVGEWLEDISHNQVHKFLRGLPPVRSLFTVGSGAAKLVSLPVKNYRKDHKLLKGIQRGAIAFLRSISLEAIGLGVHLAAGAHDVLLQTEYIFTSIPPSVSSPTRSKRKTNVRSNQPKDAQQGIQQACESLSDGLGKSASALVGNPLKTYQRGGGAGSALASAVCAAPSAAIAPASAAVRAVHCALMGVRNSLDPEHKKESMEKYLGPAQPPQFN